VTGAQLLHYRVVDLLPPAVLLTVAIPPLVIVSGVLALILGRRVRTV